MNLGLVIRSLKETRGVVAGFALGLFVFEMLLGLILPTFQKEFADKLMEVDFLQKIIAALLGTDVGSFVASTVFAMLGWVHPFVLALVWAHAIVTCTRFPAGELERGTLDTLLSLPVSRADMYQGESVGFMLGAVAVIGAGLLGNWVGGCISGLRLDVEAGRFVMVTCNLYALSLAVGGISSLLSCLSERRGRAMGGAFAFLLASFFLSSMSSFNETVKKFSSLSFLNYYRPYQVFQSGHTPWGDVAILLTVAVVTWTAGLLVLQRRDLRTA